MLIIRYMSSACMSLIVSVCVGRLVDPTKHRVGIEGVHVTSNASSQGGMIGGSTLEGWQAMER